MRLSKLLHDPNSTRNEIFKIEKSKSNDKTDSQLFQQQNINTSFLQNSQSTNSIHATFINNNSNNQIIPVANTSDDTSLIPPANKRHKSNK